MKKLSVAVLSFAVLILSTGLASGFEKDFFASKETRAETAYKDLKSQYPNLGRYNEGDYVSRIYGQAFAFGISPEASAEQFRINHSSAFYAEPEELLPVSYLKDRRHTLPIMYNPVTGEPKFTIVYYSQYRDEIPVFRSELRFLIRNEFEYPVVLAVSTLRNLGDFKANMAAVDFDLAKDAVLQDNSDLTDFSEPEVVIWAGLERMKVKPRLAVSVIAYNDFPQRWLYLVDAETSEILYKEDLIVFEDVYGLVEGLATTGTAAEHCAEEIGTPLPYARVNIGSTVAYTNSKGTFSIFNFGTDSVDVQSRLWGLYFRVYNYTGTDALLTQRVLPPGPANFVHNIINSEPYRAQVNGYYYANVIRDLVLLYVADYPSVSTQSEFPVYCNRVDGYCPGNAWYDPGDESINFCSSGSGYPNTAWQSVIHHEYGHHLVNMAGSGQGEYGEGMSDCTAMMWADESGLGFGFYGDCDTPLRDADNSLQYPCGGSIHYCGQLLSGCVWETRNELMITYPMDYLDTLRNLVFHSILLHTGTEIDPQITIDFLTLDDDDANLDNGTPHYAEICTGFGEHNMDCPELNPVWFEYTSGLPETLPPGAPTTFEVIIHPNAGEPIPGTGALYYSVSGAPFVPGTMVETSSNVYDITLPGVDCDNTIRWYISVETDGFGTVTDPKFAPSSYYTAYIVTDETIAFEDDFESDLGWTISGGLWARGTPTGLGGEYGGPDPSSAYSGTNVFGYNLNGDYENSMPERHLTSPAIDCSELTNTRLTFQRWLGVEQPIYDHAYIRISTNGSTWTTIWENESEITDYSWQPMEYDIAEYADGQPTVYLRWTMGTTDGAWRYCGWNIDDVQVSAYVCNPTGPIISTESLPDWTQGVAYSQTLEATGGNGAYTWTDKFDDLAGTGLLLSAAGVISGVPTVTGTITFTAVVADETPEFGEREFSFDINPAVSITTSSLPDWTQGFGYYQQLTATGGTGTLTWSDKNGDLSGTGLSLTSSGQVMGAPSTSGSIDFIALAVDQVGGQDEQAYSFTINPAVDITTDTLPDGLTSMPYSHQLESTGGTGTVTWTDKNDDLSGSGLTLSATGLLSGTPPDSGTYSFIARATDSIGDADEKGFTLSINSNLAITTDDVPDWTVNNPYSFQLECTGGYGIRTWSDKYGDLEGTGLSVSSEGLISGTPDQLGEITFSAYVVDESKGSDEKLFTFTINPSIEITTETLPDWTAGFLYSQNLACSGGTGTITWVDKNNDLFGTGLTLSAIGRLSGTAPTGMTVSFVAQAADQGGDVAEKEFSFIMNDPVRIDLMMLPGVTFGADYSYLLTATGGTGELTWSDKNNNLPGTGLTLSVTGLLSGTPVSAGMISFVALVSDELGASDERNFNITVNPALEITTVQLPDWTAGQMYSEQLEVAGGTGNRSWSDIYTELDGTGLTLDTDGLLSGTPVSEGTFSFTAGVSDEGGGYDEKAFSFDINPEVAITTTVLPDATVDELYSALMEASGGTAPLFWSDLYGELSGFGLEMAEDGTISGVPLTDGDVVFTAEVIDMAGGSDNQQFTIHINPAYICGDATSDETVNLLDITAIIAYLYQDGPAPDPLGRADANGNCDVNILDITYLIAFLYKDGPEPDCCDIMPPAKM